MNKNQQAIRLSVYCLAYNQAQYIRQCLDGILSQKTSFRYIVIVHDDASTDGTDDIIREYAKLYPDTIVPLFESHNQFSLQNGSIQKKMDAYLQGDYIAYCEGDDYWTDSGKLQRQVDFLDEHKDYSLSAENAITLFTKTGEEHLFSDEESRDYSFEELLLRRRFPTASVVYRAKYKIEIAKMPPPCFDTLVWCYLSKKGKVHFDSIVSSVYRRGEGITAADPIRWAFFDEAFNKSLNLNFDIPKHIRKEREKDVLKCNFTAFFVAKKRGEIKTALNLLKHSIQISPFYFITNVVKNKLEILKYRIQSWYINNHYSIIKLRYDLLPLFHFGINKFSKKNLTVVSLTSFPARFPSLHLCLKSLLNQKLRPDKVILYLDKFVQKKDIPLKVRLLRIYGLTILNVCDDIKPHNKYLYAMREYPEHSIITVDDDIIYSRNLVGTLRKSFEESPKCISATRTHYIKYDENGHALPYSSWDNQCSKIVYPSDDLLATGVGGVLYPPSIFDMSTKYFKEDVIARNCLLADDIWLKFCELYFGVKVKYVKLLPINTPIEYKFSVPKLCDKNVEENENDKYISLCEQYFGISLSKSAER